MDFNSIQKKYLKLVEKELNAMCDARVSESRKLGPANVYYYEVFKNFTLRGGKRLRPVSFVMAYKGISKKVNLLELVRAALSIELLHNGTLSHDDVMDQDELRRGGPTSWVMFRNWHKKNYGETGAVHFGEAIAILQGNSYTSLAFNALLKRKMAPENVVRAVAIMNHYYNTVNEGQLFDIVLEKSKKVSEADYMRMVKMKTAALFEAAVVMGAALGGANEKRLALFSKYATVIGQAFQIQDDILGSFGSEEGFGKPTDSDIKEGKRTLLIIQALKKASPTERELIRGVLGNRAATAAEVQRVRDVIMRTGSLDYCRKKAKQLAREGIRYINQLKLSKESDVYFTGLAEFCISREV